MTQGHKTHIIKIQNLSSGDVLVFRDSYIQNYSFKRIVNWDTTNVIGRMDPIKTYKNTEAKIDINFTVVNPHKNIIHYSLDFGSLSSNFYTKDNLNKFFKNPQKSLDNNTRSVPFTGVYSYTKNLGTIGNILYPSYTAGADNYSMKSAPVLRVVIYKEENKEITIFDGYATVNALDVNLKAEDVASPSGKHFSNTEFSILFDVIHTDEIQVVSAIEWTEAESVVKSLTGDDSEFPTEDFYDLFS